MKIPRILITPGEPAGIGPDILIQVAQEPWAAELVAVCDPDLLQERARLLNLPLHLSPLGDERKTHTASHLKILPVKIKSPTVPGHLNLKNAEYVLNCLRIATETCLQKNADALVTGPVQKSIINQAGIPFTGHTEFLAELCKVNAVLMLFVIPQMRMALVTTHLPLSKVPKAITKDKIKSSIQLLSAGLKNYFGIANPRILVSGLNPHAGEEGLLGKEEMEIVSPCLASLVKDGYQIEGPLSADTLFTEKYLKNADAILAMYHDQALPVVKALSFGKAVNITLGLPILRCSVDHGTALDLAGTGKASHQSLKAAIELALEVG